jgi:hypothetical protein
LYSPGCGIYRISIDLHFLSMHLKMKHMFTLFGQSASVSHSISFSLLIYAVMKKDNKIMLLKWDKKICMNNEVKK